MPGAQAGGNTAGQYRAVLPGCAEGIGPCSTRAELLRRARFQIRLSFPPLAELNPVAHQRGDTIGIAVEAPHRPRSATFATNSLGTRTVPTASPFGSRTNHRRPGVADRSSIQTVWSRPTSTPSTGGYAHGSRLTASSPPAIVVARPHAVDALLRHRDGDEGKRLRVHRIAARADRRHAICRAIGPGQRRAHDGNARAVRRCVPDRQRCHRPEALLATCS